MSPEADTSRPSLRYAWFVVGVLMVAYIFSFVDRQILSLLVAPIRKDLAISDTQMSLLGGISFALFYTLCGIPLGRMADNRSRRAIIGFGVFFWSLATAACGLAQKYWHLFAARIGVGVGEAALSPAAYSMIADYFPREQRATAISVYSTGIYLGSGIAFLVGGLVIKFANAHGPVMLPLLGETRPWQVVFLILGGIGAVFSLVFMGIREPARENASPHAVPFGEVLAYMRTNLRTVLGHNFGFALLSLSSYGAAFWIPAFFQRTHGWDIGRVSLIYGSIVMIFGAGGIIFGGRLADRWMARGRTDAPLRVGLYAALACVPFGAAWPLAPNGELAALLLAPAVFALAMPFGVAPAAIQDIMPNRMRGQASAIYLFIVNLIGLGIGPTAMALVTDYVFHDDAAVRWSILIVGAAAQAVAVLLLWSSLAPYRASVARARSG